MIALIPGLYPQRCLNHIGHRLAFQRSYGYLSFLVHVTVMLTGSYRQEVFLQGGK
jgi:hypothetical protein